MADNDYPEYFGGTPTAGYRPAKKPVPYFGGTPTAGYAEQSYLDRTPYMMKPEEDLSQSTWLQDWWETKGKANRLRYLARNARPADPNARPTMAQLATQTMHLQRAAELDAEFDRRNQMVSIDHPAVKMIVDQARAEGVRLNPGDFANLARVGELERAKNVIMDRLQNQDTRGANNAMLTLMKRDPKLAAMLPPVIEDALADAAEKAKEAAENPDLIDDVITWFAESPWSPVRRGLEGLSWVNDQVRHVGAAAGYRPEGQGFGDEASGLLVPLRVVQNWDTTSRGSYDQERLSELRKQYPAEVVDAMLEITTSAANGDDTAIVRMLADDSTSPQVATFLRDILYNGPTLSEFDARRLREEVEGSRIDNAGDLFSTGVARLIDEQTGDETFYYSDARATLSKFTNLAWEVGTDPLNYIGTPIRAVTAARYAITKLAPSGLAGEAARMPIAQALKSRKVAGFETNRARRYFQGILDQLDHIDTMTPGSVEASSAWQRLVRQHREIPEDILRNMADPANIQKVNGRRTMDGALIGDGAGATRRADGFIDYIVNENDRWQALVGNASEKATKAGESFLIEQAVKMKLIDELEPDDLVALAAGKRPKMDLTTEEILEIARRELPEEILKAEGDIMQGTLRRYGGDSQPLAARFVQKNKRDQVIPYTGVFGDLRRRSVNGIIAERIGATRTQTIIDEFIGEDISPEAVAAALDSPEALAGMATADRGVLSGRPGRAQALSDRVSGLFSSMPNGRFINIATGENAEEVYRFARMFYNRKTAEFLVDKFRRGDEGTRRLLLAGLIRSAAATRGVKLSQADVWARFGDLATGSRPGEMFAIPTPGSPSADMMKATLDQADVAQQTAKKLSKRLKRATEDHAALQAQLQGAIDAGDEAAARSLERQVRRSGSKLSKLEYKLDAAKNQADQYKRRLITALGMNDEIKPSGFQERIPPAMADDVERNLLATADQGVLVPEEVVDVPVAALDEGAAVVDDVVEVAAPAEPIRLPKDLASAKPKYRDKNLTFTSDIDRALYIVRSEAKRSKADEKYMQWLREQFPDMSDDAIRAKGDTVADRIKALYNEPGDRVVVPEAPVQRVLADDGTLADEVQTIGGIRAGEYDIDLTGTQIALDAQGMTPVPQEMTGARMQEMPFDSAAGRQPLPKYSPEDGAPWRAHYVDAGVSIQLANRGSRRVYVDVVRQVLPDGTVRYEAQLRVAAHEYTGDTLRSFSWDSNGKTDTVYAAEDGQPWHARDLETGTREAAQKYDMPVPDTFLPVRKLWDEVMDEQRRLDAAMGIEDLPDAELLQDGVTPVSFSTTGRERMPMGPLNDLSFPDRPERHGNGYLSSIKSGKTELEVNVTEGATRRGNPTWKIEVGKDPSKEFELTANVEFDEWGNIIGSVWRSAVDSQNGYSKAKYALVAKAVVQEAKKYDIPVRGELADWLEMMGAKPVRDMSPASWNAEDVVNAMSVDEMDAFVHWALRQNPRLGQRDELWGPPLQRSNAFGRGTAGTSPGVDWENPEVRQLLAYYLGKVDGKPRANAALMDEALTVSSSNIPNGWTRKPGRVYESDDGWRIEWIDGEEVTQGAAKYRTTGGYRLTDPDGNVIKRVLPGVDGSDRELDTWLDLSWALDKADSLRGRTDERGPGVLGQADRDYEELMASRAPESTSPALDPAEEAIQGFPTFDEFLEADPRFDEFSTLMEQLGTRFDERLAAELEDMENAISADWASKLLDDADIQAAYLDDIGIPNGLVPEHWRNDLGQQFDDQVDLTLQGNGFKDGAVHAQEALAEPVRLPDGTVKYVSEDQRIYWEYGALSPARFMDQFDELNRNGYGEEAMWAWWNTGDPEAYTDPRFFERYGAPPKMLPDPGTGLMPARRAAMIPGEYKAGSIGDPLAVDRKTAANRAVSNAEKAIERAKASGDAEALLKARKRLDKALDLKARGGKESKRNFLKVPWKQTSGERDDYIARRYADMQEEAIESARQGNDRVALQRYVDAVLAERKLAALRRVEADEAADDIVDLTDDAVDEVVEVDEIVVPQVTDTSTTATPAAEVTVSPPPSLIPEAQPVEPEIIEGVVVGGGTPPGQPPAPPGNPLNAPGPGPEPKLPKIGELQTWLNDYQANGKLPERMIDGDLHVTPSQDANGREHALHLYQTSDYMVIPHLDEIEAFGRVRRVLPWLHSGLQTSTDIWSLATLYGYRFAMRSSIEDLMAFALTGGLGHGFDLYRGRRGSTAIREAAPHIVAQQKKVAGKLADEIELVTPATDQWWALGRSRPRTSRLGMVARTSRQLSDWLHRGNRESTQQFWLSNIPQDKILHAASEIQSGRYGAMQELIFETTTRMHYPLVKLSDGDIRALQLLGGTHAGRALLEDMAEAGAQINSGTYRMLDDAMQAAADNPDLAAVGFKRPVVFGDFKKLALSANLKSDPFADWYWHRNIQAIVRDDGPIGMIFVKLMHDPDTAKRAIADAIRKDTRLGYKERFSLITGDASIEDFAHRYYEASLPYFQRADGTINESLRSSFIDEWIDPKSGKRKMRVNWYAKDKKGREFMRLTSKDLARMPREDKPLYVLGREEKVVMPKSEKALMDRAWDWMGNQYARIAREPIFIGNYIANMRALKPMQDNLAQAVANGRAGKVGAKITKGDTLVAEAAVARQAQDAAYAFTLNYMDNPANRSVLAWKVRNVARYYRATEDFARRATRLAKNYPDAYYKLAMTYQVLEDTGFTYRDENGDLYFAYPANSYLQDAFSVLGMFTNGIGTPVAADPFMIGGLVKNIAPSTDPSQWAPTFTGVVTLPLTFVFNQFPQMQGLRAATLGTYSSAGQTGNLTGELLDAILPAGVKKIWSQMEPGERDASISSAAMGATASLIAEGRFDHVYDTENPLTLEQLKKDDVFAEAQRRAIGIVTSKMFLGYTGPAAPQVYQNNVTTFAREQGIESIDALFHTLLEENDGDYTAAFLDWQRLDPDGKLLPFTVSKTKSNPDMLAGLTGAQPYIEVVEWMRSENVADLAEKFPDSYLFLAPQNGEFDWGAWGIIRSMGLRVSKTENEMLIDMFAATGERNHREIIKAYDMEMAQYTRDTDEGRAMLNALEDQKSAAIQLNKDRNPYWATKSQTRLEPYDVESIRQQFVQTQEMLSYLSKDRTVELTGTAAAIQSAIDVYMQINVTKSTISPYTDAGKAERGQLDAELAEAFTIISEVDPGAANFIESILSSQSLFGRLT